MIIFVGIGSFVFGAIFGMFTVAALVVAHDEDEWMQQRGRRDEK